MLDNPYIIVLGISILIILSYLFNIVAKKVKIPSVLLLITTGILAKYALEWSGYPVPEMHTMLSVFGIIGLILIVLEGALELKLAKSKMKVIKKSLASAFVVLLFSSLTIAAIIFLILTDQPFIDCLVNAIPLAVISSAIAIPSVMPFAESQKEFIIYESIFSDILGILLFNFMITFDTFSMGKVAWLGLDIVLEIVFSVIITFAILYFLDRIKLHIKFFLLIAMIIMLYSIGKLFHLSSLVLVLFFGLFLNNLDIIWNKRIAKHINYERIKPGLEQFRLVTFESAFLVRTLFFFVFGFTIDLNSLASLNVWLIGLLILFVLFGVRFLYLKYIARLQLFPNLFVAPRGLITILLYFSIPVSMSIGAISEGVLLFVILSTGIIMTIGLIKSPASEWDEIKIHEELMKEQDDGVKLPGSFDNENTNEPKID